MLSKIQFTGWATILFVGLKLTNVISWSWGVTLIPLWIGLSALALRSLCEAILHYTHRKG